MDNLQKLKPDLKEIYEKVMNTPTQPIPTTPKTTISETPKPSNGIINGSKDTFSHPPVSFAQEPTTSTQQSSAFAQDLKTSPFATPQKPVSPPQFPNQNGFAEKAKVEQTHFTTSKNLPTVEEIMPGLTANNPEPFINIPKPKAAISSFEAKITPPAPSKAENSAFSTFANFTKTEEKSNTLVTPPPPTPMADVIQKQKPQIPNPVVVHAKSKVGKLVSIIMIIFFIFYTIGWLFYFGVINKTMLGL